MADYDHAAFQYPQLSEPLDDVALAGGFDLAGVTDPNWLDEKIGMQNAFGGVTGGGGEVANGYGYGLSG